jgi:hypothetical protein
MIREMKSRCGLIVILLTLVWPVDVTGQSKLEKDIVGVWKPSRIYDVGAVVPDAHKEKIKVVQEKLLDSRFEFKDDHKFSFDFFFHEMEIKNGHWKILPDNGEIIIQEWEDKDKPKSVLMSITVLQKDGKTIFMLEETFFAFEMLKINNN